MAKNKNGKFGNRYSDQLKAEVVALVRKLQAQGVKGAVGKVAAEYGVSYPSVTDWVRQANRNELKRPTPHPHVEPEVAARNEAEDLAEVMANEAVSDHSSGGIHPLLTAYEDAAEKFDHQRTIVDTLHAELTVHTERLADLEREKDSAKKSLQEMVNSL